MPRRPKAPDPEPPARRRRRRGSGSISTSADGTIRARLPARVDAKRTAREFPPGHLAEAVAWLDSHLHPRPPDPPAREVVTLGTWTGHWWQTYVEPIRPPNTAAWYRYALAQLAEHDSLPIADVRASLLQAAIGMLARRVDAATVQGIAGVWRRCLEAAVDDELIARNPAKRLILPKAPPRVVRRHVTPAEAAALREAIVGHRFEVAYALLLGCGLRIGEVLGLAWEHVRLHERRAWIQRQWTNSHWRELPKGRVPRWVTLPPLVMAALIRHRDRQPPGAVLVLQSPWGGKAGRKGKRSTASGPIPWSRQAVASDLAALVAELQLPHLTPHAARHGLASALLDGGVPAPVIAEMLGHSNAGVTLKHYVHPSEAGRAQAGEVVRRYLGEGAPDDDSGSETA